MALGTLEIEILNTIWNLQSKDEDSNISVKDVVENLSDSSINRAYTTVKTVMDRLSTKELLVRYRSGKKFFYRTITDKNEMAKSAIMDIAKRFFNENYAEMIRFIESECLTIIK
jgi:predicted transcriptional regulator